jgi:hypothetical protein
MDDSGASLADLSSLPLVGKTLGLDPGQAGTTDFGKVCSSSLSRQSGQSALRLPLKTGLEMKPRVPYLSFA